MEGKPNSFYYHYDFQECSKHKPRVIYPEPVFEMKMGEKGQDDYKSYFRTR
jgi:hypothetical protein